MNILDLAHLSELRAAVERARSASVVVVAADGRAFSAGNDVADHAPDRAPEMLARFHAAVGALVALDAITIADVRGDALGGGCELACACDLVYAAPGARFGQPEIDVGCFPPVAAALLPRRIGWGRAVEMMATGRPVDAATAERWGLVTRLGPPDDVVATLLGKSAPVLAALKSALRAGTIEGAERVYVERLLPLADCAEGVAAFLAKRAPAWSHESLDSRS